MTTSNFLKSIGPIVQMAFVPDDFDAAVKHWTETMGVGPFFWIEHSGLENMKFKGNPSDVDFGLALGYWGDIQIELIKQHNDSASIYNTSPYARSGLHHVCLLTEDIHAAEETVASCGGEVVFEADVPGGGGVFYADPGGQNCLVEVLQPAPGSSAFFDMMRAASVDWDGKDPLRSLG